MRNAQINRKTTETDISLSLELDGTGKYDIDTGCGFLNHMLELFTRHGRFDITLKCIGDTYVDDHHTVEDIGIALGQAFSAALGEKRGIKRYGQCILPMDESLILTAVDISGRGMLGFDLSIPTQKVGTFDTELVQEFWIAFARNSGCTLHIKQLAGTNSHHIIEGTFKSAARSLRDAVSIDQAAPDSIPSTKGLL
jgi:imidazoleglycerol-phosphate dehydratase